MTKRDDESPTDMEVGMTTAERRRRRRRGAGLRVPSDNVPRRASTPPVAPVPEDPSLAMSIAYSFAPESSESVARVVHEALPSFEDDDDMAAMDLPGVIDPVSGPIEQADFEIHTREMIAVDAEVPEEFGEEQPAAPSARSPDLPHVRPPGEGAPPRPTPESLSAPPWPTLDSLPPPRPIPEVPPLRSVLDGIPPAPRPVPEGSAPRPAPEGMTLRHAPEGPVHRPVLEGLSPLRPLPEGPPRPAVEGPPLPRLQIDGPPRPAPESSPRLQVEGPPPPPRPAAVEMSQARPPLSEMSQARPPLTDGARPALDSSPARPAGDSAALPRSGLEHAALRTAAVEVSQPRPPLGSLAAGPLASAPPGAVPPVGPGSPITGASSVSSPSMSPPLSAAPAGYRTGRAQTVALSEDDLEEVREAARLGGQPPRRPASPSIPPPMPPTKRVPAPRITQPESVPEIDIRSLEDRAAEASGEFEVDVEGIVESRPELPRGERLAAEAAPADAPSVDPRARTVSLPPGAGPVPPVTVPRDSQQTPLLRDPHAPPPPPHKAPPAPPPGKKDKPAPASVAPAAKPELKPEGKAVRGKPWFIELFDEDYLRTLPFLTPQATQAEAEFVIDALGLTAGAQVLDVGCGYGRHAMELAARGFHVVGLDLSTPLLVRGGEEAHRRGLTINFVRGDMRELDFDAQFDGAYCLFSTFGYFDDETNKKTAANIARALRPGGRVLIEILNRDYVIADLPTRVWWEGDGCVVLEEVELNYFSSRIQVNRSVVFDDGRQLEQEISVRAYSLHEIGKLMHSAGLRVLEVSGAYHTRGRFFGNQSRHIIVLAERKDASGVHPGVHPGATG